MARPHIAPSAHKRGVTFHDVDAVLRFPEKVMKLSDTHTGQPERPNVDLYAGYDTSGEPLVVFVDRFENMAFHSEPGLRRYKWLF
ncbi:MAG: hypothetical protein OXK16_12200 [bacterium]|nr:hypothetical protein [bacterium]